MSSPVLVRYADDFVVMGHTEDQAQVRHRLAGWLWMQLLALTSTNDTSGAQRWEPKRLRLRLFTIAAALTRHSRQVVLTLNQKQPWATLAHQAVTALRALPAPG